MPKKLTLYEINSVARQLDKTIITPITLENNKILESIPDSEEINEIINRILFLTEQDKKILEERNCLINKLELGYLYPLSADNLEKGRVKAQLKYKQTQYKLRPIPTNAELRDLIILNNNLELQDIISKITEMYFPKDE